MAYTTINKSGDYFNSVLYVGNGTAIGSGGKTVTGVGFQPDFVWGKARSGTDAVDNHELTDAVRGATKYLKCNTTSAETTNTESLTSFTNDGFTLGSNGQLNRNGNNCVAWNWKANGAGSSNTDGSITSTVSANTTSGFSIVTYSGTGSAGTVGHGLGSVPKMMIIKNRDNTQGWATYHHTQGAGNYLDLSSTNTVQAGSSIFNNTTPTSSVFSVATSGWTNDSGYNYLAYCFADVTGYSKFGSYLGNESSDGTFIYTGFKPAFFITKCRNTGNTQDWVMKDNRRPGYNQIDDILYPNGNYAEGHGADVDFLSNGIKIRSAAYNINRGGGNEYIYMAFAEAPLVGSNGVTAKAR